MTEQDQLVDLDGQLHIRKQYEEINEPKRTTYYWPIGQATKNYIAHAALFTKAEVRFPIQVTCLYSDGWYMACQTPWGLPVKVRMVNGSSTQATKIETETIAPPKVRPGVELRWRRGRWEKLLKRDGWVPA